MKKNKNNKIKLLALALILVITVAYAALRTGLNINGTANVSSSSWSVYFDNLQATANSNVTPTDVSNPTSQNKLTTISYTVNLSEPGDVYEFTVDTVNDGTIDAMIESVSSKLNNVEINNNLPAYLDYSVSYDDDTTIGQNDLLAHNNTKTYKVMVGYKTDIDPSDLPEENQALHLDLTITYVQADSNAVDPHAQPAGNYVVTYTTMYIGQQVPNGVNLRLTPQEAMNDWIALAGSTKPFYLKYTIENDVITESYVEFVVTEEVVEANPGMVAGRYTLKGGNGGTAFTENMNTLKTAFDYANHSSRCSGNQTSDFNCDVSGVHASAGSDGNVHAFDNGFCYGCGVDSVGSSYCVGES